MRSIWLIVAGVVCLRAVGFAAELHVGPAKPYARIEEAYAKSASGDVILVHEQADGKAYEKVALQVRKPKVTFKGVAEKEGHRVKLSGEGFDYSGSGAVPRAIFQFDPGADGCVVEGFELCDARNDSSNGAGVRINQANHVTVRNCEIHHNDMGIMSNGDASAPTPTAADQLIESCVIHHNGSDKSPGYNHNLYLGGTSVRLVACEVHSSTTGHNVKSRAHFNWIECCWIHDSANREFDLVDERKNTDIAGSDSVLLGNVIVKKKDMNGNKTVIHFGQDGGNEHDGTIWLIHNTIVTPYISPVVQLSAGKTQVQLVNNVVYSDTNQQGQVVVGLAAKAGGNELAKVAAGSNNYFSAGFAASVTFPSEATTIGKPGERLAFASTQFGDYSLRRMPTGRPWDQIKLPTFPGETKPPELRQYFMPGPMKAAARIDAKSPLLGAFEEVRK